MISKDKIRIRLNILLRTLLYHCFFWTIGLFFYVFIVGPNHIFWAYEAKLGVDAYFISVIVLGLFTAIVFTFFDIFFTDRVMRFFPIGLTRLLRLVFYSVAGFLIVISTNLSIIKLEDLKSVSDLIIYLPDKDINLLRFLIYFYILCFLNNFFIEIVKKIGPGNFQNWAFGFLNKPIEQERIFMFIDLKSSTTIAEKLLHKKFSHLVQDVFNDMAIVDNYGGEIYQYMGDGAIISWNIKKGLRHCNFIRSYYAFTHIIYKRRRYYKRKYNLEPKFKAGVHVGKVMVLQVGKIRRDISYNGDTMNTAARIESKCNELKQELLISNELHKLLPESVFKFKNVGNITLRGKKKAVEIYAVKK